MPKIKSAVISAQPLRFGDPMPTVTVTYDDDTTETLFEYYPDEIQFTAAEFVGLTREQAISLRHQKDVAYLRS